MDVISPELLYKTRDEAIELGRIATRFARVERAPRMPDGRRETDVEHSFCAGWQAHLCCGNHMDQGQSRHSTGHGDSL